MPSKYVKKRRPKAKNWASGKPMKVLLERKLRKMLRAIGENTAISNTRVNVNCARTSPDKESDFSQHEAEIQTEPIAGFSGSQDDSNLLSLHGIATCSTQVNRGTSVTSDACSSPTYILASPEQSSTVTCSVNETSHSEQGKSTFSKLWKVKELLPSYFKKLNQKNLPDVLPLLLKAVLEDNISDLSYLFIYETLKAVNSSKH